MLTLLLRPPSRNFLISVLTQDGIAVQAHNDNHTTYVVVFVAPNKSFVLSPRF
jgi:hypothetical protein